jgi:SnoaL-like domain
MLDPRVGVSIRGVLPQPFGEQPNVSTRPLRRHCDPQPIHPTATVAYRLDVATHGNVAWLLATGTETANTAGVTVSHSYRMTLVGTRRAGRWTLIQAHGSSPQA